MGGFDFAFIKMMSLFNEAAFFLAYDAGYFPMSFPFSFNNFTS